MTSSEAASTARESLCSLRRRNSSRTYHARSSGVSRSRQALDCTQPGQGRHRDCWCEFSLLEKPRCTIVSSPPPGCHFSTRNDRPCRDEGKPVLQAAPLLIHTTTSLSSAGRVTTIATAQQPGDPDRSSPHRSGAPSKCTDEQMAGTSRCPHPTGVRASFPPSTAAMLRAASSVIFSRVRRAAEPMWGRSTTLSMS